MLFLTCFASISSAQYYNLNDERYKFLALKKAEIRLQEAKNTFETNKSLLEKNLVSVEVFNASKSAYRVAEIEFQQALLAVVFEKPYITIESAVKYISESGQRRVRLTVRNSSGSAPDMASLSQLEDSADALSLVNFVEYDRLTNVYVSLKEEGSIISRPYEQKIDVLPYGEEKTLEFDLLSDVDDAVVSISYAGEVNEKKIRLTKDFNVNPLAMVSNQFSQEAILGGQARYDLRIEQYSGESATYQLMAVNLPEQISYEFTSVSTGVRVSQVKFGPQVSSQNLLLTLYLPDRVDENVSVDTPLTFYVVAADADAASMISEKSDRFAAAQLDSIGGARVLLELIPRGIGEIELDMDRLYYQVDAGEPLEIAFAVRNVGSLSLFNVGLSMRAPYGWEVHITPESIDRLGGGDAETVRIECDQPADIAIGDYEFIVEAEALVNNRMVSAPEKTVRASVVSGSGPWGTVSVILLMLAIIVGGAVFFVRMSKR